MTISFCDCISRMLIFGLVGPKQNAISFAMNGNIALSMEIGSAYALQVCLLQIPALVFYSAVHGQFVEPSELQSHSFK